MSVNNSKSIQGQSQLNQPSPFKGKPITDFEAYLASLPYIADPVAAEAFECVIEEERRIRRQMAQGKAD